ncbi:MAG: hypothetical protein OEO83_09065, partial [Alphaproteobacteria bacterium]|nr:hypothetical protein [Alphaproteobacteria bacterium]
MGTSIKGSGSAASAVRSALRGALILVLAVSAGQACAVAQDRQTAKAENAWDPGPLSTPYGDYLAARHAEAINDSPLAARLLERTLKHAPDDPEILRMALHQMLAAGYMGRAVAIAKRYLALRPQSVFAGLTVAVDDVAAGRLDDGVKALKAIPNRGLGGYVVPMTLAWTLAGKKEVSEAFDTLEPFGKRRGLQFIHDLHAALIHDFVGNTEEAGRLFEKVAGGENPHLRLVELAGSFYERHGQA